MTVKDFENILDKCCTKLTGDARTRGFSAAAEFESAVRVELAELTKNDSSFEIDFNPRAQAFPDIAMGEYGVEVKFTLSDKWSCIANSVLETQRIDEVKYIYVVFGKMGGVPEVRWGEYEKSVIHVRTSHVPRFEIELPSEKRTRDSLFAQMGITYGDFSRLTMREKMKYVRAYARKLHPDGGLWWVEDEEGADEHTTPLQVRLYTNLSAEEKTALRAEVALLFPSIVKSGRVHNKYDDMVLYLLTYHGILCHQARDLFSAGSVANPQNREPTGGVYIERALKLIEPEMRAAALRMGDAVFRQYWGESVPPEKRIARWLEKADELATNWVPSKFLFRRR